MKKWLFIKIVIIIILVNFQCLAQLKASWAQDSLKYSENVARAYRLGTAKRDSALIFATKALEIAQFYKNKNNEAESLNQIGGLSASYGERVEFFFKALKLYEKLNNLKGIGDTYLKLAEEIRIQSNNKYPKEVLEYSQNALGLFKKINDLEACARANNLIGIYYAMKGPKELAMPYFEAGRNNLIIIKADSSRIMSAEYNIANFLYDFNPNESMKRRLVIYSFFKRNPSWPRGFALLEGLCLYYEVEKRPEEVLKYAFEGLEKASLVQNLGRQVIFNHYISKAYKSLKNYENALFYAEKVRILSDSVSRQQDAARIAEAQQKYENEKKQTEIEKQGRLIIENQLSLEQATNQKASLDKALLLKNQQLLTQKVQEQLKEARLLNQNQKQKTNIQQLKVVNLKQANENQQLINQQFALQIRILLGLALLVFGVLFWRNRQLRLKNKEISEALLKGQTTERHRVAIDLHDNLGSTLSSIGFSMEAIDKSKMNDHEKDIYKNLQEMVTKAYNDVRLLSHNLLPEDFEKLGLKATLESFIRKINKASKIKFELNIDENFGRQNYKIEFELYSICMELVNNIMKHSKATEAKIELSQTGERIKLLVSDNGIGIFKNDSDGKGMKNVQARVDSIDGVWKVKAAEGGGVVNEIVV